MKKLIYLTLLIFAAVSFKAQAQLSFESYASKSIYSFIRYINWPSEVSNEDFKVAVIGDYQVYEALDKLLSNRRNGNNGYEVTYVKKASEYNGFNHIVFVDAYQSSKITELMASMNNQNTLVISETEGATEKGAMINFIPRNGTMKFELSQQNIESKGLKVDSRLAALAVPM